MRVLIAVRAARGMHTIVLAALLHNTEPPTEMCAIRITRELAFGPRVDLDAGWRGTGQALRASGLPPEGVP